MAEGLTVLKGPCCLDRCDVFSVALPLDFPVPLVDSTLLSKVGRCLVSLALLFGVFRRALHVVLLCWTVRVPVLDCETVRGCTFSVAILEFLGCDRLKGIGLVHGLFFFAFPYRKIKKALRI